MHILYVIPYHQTGVQRSDTCSDKERSVFECACVTEVGKSLTCRQMCGEPLNDEFLYSLDYFLFWRALAPRAMAAALLPQEVGSDQLMERNAFPRGVGGSSPVFSVGGKSCVFVV